MRPFVINATVLLAGSLLTGLSFCALLPPFEGFDEAAHYSYVQQIAETGTWPRSVDPASADIDDYLQSAPSPLGTYLFPAGPYSFSSFFKSSAATVHAGANAIHGDRDPNRSWRAGTRKNYEGQHPPLYYSLVAPLWLMSKGWSVYAQLVMLRAVSYLFAWCGLVIATVSIAYNFTASQSARLTALGPALWPALFPMWFPEMARLGNDSLVLLLLALALVAMRKAFSPDGKVFHFALLGATCGLALLAKATTLPFAAALGVFLIWRTWAERHDATALRMWATRLCVLCSAILAVAGWWYVRNLYLFGGIAGSSDTTALAQQGGLLKGLKENFALMPSIFGVTRDVQSFLWTGTGTFVHPQRVFEIPLNILLAAAIGGWIYQQAKAKGLAAIDAISVLTLLMFIIALLIHMLVFIALLGAFLPGAWYLHSLAPLLAPLVLRGLAETWGRARVVVSALIIYPTLFLPYATLLVLFYFAGCFDEPADVARSGLNAINGCINAPQRVLTHLSALGAPRLAIPLFGIGCITMLVGVVLVVIRNLSSIQCANQFMHQGGTKAASYPMPVGNP